MGVAGAIRGRVADLGYAAGWAGVKAVPESFARRMFAMAADSGTRRNGESVEQLRRNLRRVVGEQVADDQLDVLVHDAMRSYARYWCETFRLPKMSVESVVSQVQADGVNYIDEAAAAGRGAVLALPHSGNWDIAGLWLIARGYPFTTVAERLKPESLYRRFVDYREGIGMEVLPLTGGDVPVMQALADRLRAGGVVCLLADRDLSRHGVPVRFFGQASTMPPGPALLALQTGAALIPVTLAFSADGWSQRIYPPVPCPQGDRQTQVRLMTQSLADSFAEGIARHPADWHMLQRLWVQDRVAREDSRAEVR